MPAGLDQEALRRLVELALREDLGPGDITAEATVPESATATARVLQKQEGVVFGREAVEEVCAQVGSIELARECEEGRWRGLDLPAPVAQLSGPARAVLAAERTALNFLGCLSGVATMTARYVAAVRGTDALILDTRKTTPGMRRLEKAAVAAGGGTNHRAGLYDAYLIKENHLALAGGVTTAVEAARGRGGDERIEVECETLDQLREAVAAGADGALLDNMDLETLAAAVEMRDSEAGRPRREGEAGGDIETGPGSATVGGGASAGSGLPDGFLLEASGGITLDNVRRIAETGVELISVGALTHSAPALDFSMLVEVA